MSFWNFTITEGGIIIIIGLVFTNILTPIITYKIAIQKTKGDYYNKALQNRYYLVYCPLIVILLETHIIGCGTGFTFSQRIKMAIRKFCELKIKDGIKILSKNYRENVSYEVEYGDPFPLAEIKKIINKNIKWADTKLILLLREADYSNDEPYSQQFNELEVEKYKLHSYIWRTYEELNKRLLPEL